MSPSDHLKQKTNEWKELAKTPGYEQLHSMIVMGDLKSNEIFDHNKCWKKLKRDAQMFLPGQNSEEKNKTFYFNLNYCFRKIYHQLYENLYDNPSQSLHIIQLRFNLKRPIVQKQTSGIFIR